MSDWRTYLKSDPTDWLLEPDNPSVRYFTLTKVLDRLVDDADVLQTRAAIMESEVVRVLLTGQEDAGYWGEPEQFYNPRFYGATWRLILLTELGSDGGDERMQEAVDYLVAKQNRDGRWKLQRTFNDRMPVQIEEKGQPSKWITLRALMALKGFYG